jgi:hypothetical protein
VTRSEDESVPTPRGGRAAERRRQFLRERYGDQAADDDTGAPGNRSSEDEPTTDNPAEGPPTGPPEAEADG